MTSPFDEFKTHLKRTQKTVDRALSAFLAEKTAPPVLSEAMRHSTLNGGKRLRPALLLAAARAYGLGAKKALPAACAFELVHSFSLVHDDLPALDNDDLRRGKPATHKVFGEATALLAGDAMIFLAFELLSRSKAEPSAALTAVELLARAAGAAGMTGGQTADLFAEGLPRRSKRLAALKKSGAKGGGKPLSYYLLPGTPQPNPSPARILPYIHLHKAAALIAAPLEAGAVLGAAPEKERRLLRSFGLDCGLAFQITDDILDVAGDKKLLGKKGSDANNRKLTYVSLHGLERSRKMVYSLLSRAKKSLCGLKTADQGRLAALYGFAEYLQAREY